MLFVFLTKSSFYTQFHNTNIAKFMLIQSVLAIVIFIAWHVVLDLGSRQCLLRTQLPHQMLLVSVVVIIDQEITYTIRFQGSQSLAYTAESYFLQSKLLLRRMYNLCVCVISSLTNSR